MMKNDIQSKNDTLKSKILGTKELAEYLACSEKLARQIMKSKGFPLLMIGKNMRVFKSSLEKWIEKQENKSIKERY